MSETHNNLKESHLNIAYQFSLEQTLKKMIVRPPDWITQAINIWEAKKIKLQPGLPDIKIQGFEKSLGFKFPPDFIELYKYVNGFTNYAWDENMFSVWSLERIVDEYQESIKKEFVVFSDYLIGSNLFGFNKKDRKIYKYIGKYESITDTYSKFIGLLNSNDKLLY